MIRKHLLVLIAILNLLVLASCASTPPKQAAVQGEEALVTVRDLTKAYEKRDLNAFLEKVADGYKDREAFRKTVERTFAAYQTIRLTVQDTRMLVMIQYKGNVKVGFTWAGEWQTAGGRVHKDGGRSTLVLDPTSYKLLSVEGKNPYIPVESTMPGK